MPRLTYVLVGLAVASGCHKNPNYCPGANPNDNCAEIDAAGSDAGCSTSDQCTAPAMPVCNTATMTCVQCTASEAQACTGTTPVCGPENTCRGCSTHDECTSGACLPDGSCGSDSSVAFVDPAGTDNAMCTKAMPCTKVAKAIATNRPYIKFHGTIDEAVTINDTNVTFLADPGAKLTRTNNGNVLVIDGTSNVAIFDLEISGASGTGAGISIPSGGTQQVTLTRVKLANNIGGGVSAAGGKLTVSQSRISNNAGGGILLTNGTFAIVGNVFFANGTGTGTVGGVSISTAQSASNRLEFNSFNQNQTQTGAGSAIQCLAGTFTAKNNIMSGNGTLANMEQVGGTCAHAFSIARPGTLPPGSGNSAADPMFVNTTTGDLHITSGSPAREAADPNSDLTGIAAHDFDGDLRTDPADIGADQLP